MQAGLEEYKTARTKRRTRSNAQNCINSSQSIMTSHSLLVLVFAMSCFTSSSCNDGGDIASVPVTYPPKVLSTTQEECPPDDQRETVRAEVEQDICYILRVYVGNVCPNLINPENGQVVQLLNGNVPGTVANYSCNAGYGLLGNVSRECVSMGMEAVWTGEAPTCQREYTDCKDALTQGQTTSGVYTVKPDNQSAFQVYCDMDTDGGGWTVFQRREDGSVDFNVNWADYQQGFGNLSGEFWLGLEKIHRLTSTATQLRVDMQDFEGNSAYAQYSSFSVGDSASKYTLSVSGYSGTAGDSLIYHNGRKFSTRDQDNDDYDRNCAQLYTGGWWYGGCHDSNLNGLYHGGLHSNPGEGVNWRTRNFYYSQKFTEMKLRKN